MLFLGSYGIISANEGNILMEITDKSKAKKLETLIDEMMLSPTPNGKELVKVYIEIQEKLERKESLSAMESIKLLELVKLTIGEYKEKISGLKKNLLILTITNNILKVLGLLQGNKGAIDRNYATASQTSIQNIFPNLEKVEQAVEDTKDNLDTEKVVNTILAYKELVKYSHLMDSANSKPEQLSSESAEDIEQISQELEKTQVKINQLTSKSSRGGQYGFRKK